jgi:hypothetical protein
MSVRYYIRYGPFSKCALAVAASNGMNKKNKYDIASELNRLATRIALRRRGPHAGILDLRARWHTRRPCAPVR